MNIIFSKFKSFRTQIFFAFILILILIVIWFLFYGYIDKKIDKLNDFNYKTYQTSKDFSVNIKNFQAFQYRPAPHSKLIHTLNECKNLKADCLEN